MPTFNKILQINANTEVEAAQIAQAFMAFQKVFKPTEILKISKSVQNPLVAAGVRAKLT